MKKHFLFLLFILLIIVAAYFLNSNYIQYEMVMENSTPKEFRYDEKTVGENFGVGIYNSPNLTDGMQLSQFLDPQSNFSGWLRITNAMYGNNTYMVFTLLDYKQQTFFFNNQTAKLHLVNLSRFEDNFYYFQINNISKGFHDLVFIVVLNPYEHSLSKEYRYFTDMGKMGDKRLNLFVGGVTDAQIIDTFNGTPCPSSYVLNGLLVNKKACSSNSWLSEKIKEKEDLNYFINVGNDDEILRSFALMTFLNYEQIPLNFDDKELTVFGKLKKGEKRSIPANLTIPKEGGIDELMVVWILDPYEKLETSPGVRAEIDARVEPSIRIGLYRVE